MSLFSGVKGFIWQNISAFYLLLFTPYLAWLTLSESFNTTLILQPSVFIPGLVAIVLVLIHAWIGLRDVLIDYAPRRFLPLFFMLIFIVGLALVANLFWLGLKLGGWA